MNGIIFNIQRFAIHDGPGVRTTVFLKGCPLKCQWCHNPESINPNPEVITKHYQLNGKTFACEECIGYKTSAENLMQELTKDELLMDESQGGVTFSGGEPLMQHRFLETILQLCRNQNIHTVVDTSLFAPWKTVEQIANLTNLLLIDIKTINDELHKKHTGVSNKLILENIKKLAIQNHTFHIRIPVISTVNDNEKSIGDIIHFISEMKDNVIGVDVLPFHNIAKTKYEKFNKENHLSHLKSTATNKLEWIKIQFQKAGFNAKIGG